MDILSNRARIALFDSIGVPMPSDTDGDRMRAVWRECGIRSLYFFSGAILQWSKLQPVPHKELCDFIQSVDPPHGRRKVVLIPRDTYKSTIGSKSLPLWILIQPSFCGIPGREHRILLWSHASDNAKKQIKSIQQQVERNPYLAWLYPELIPDIANTTWTSSNLLFPRDGMYGEDSIEAAGLDTHLVSRHYTVQIKDDMEDKASFEQPSVRQKVIDSYKSSEALFVDEQTAFDLLIGTRWGHDDLYSHIQENEHDTYEFLVRPLHWTRDELEVDLKEARETQKQPVWGMDPDAFAPEYGKTYYFFEKLFPEASCRRIKAKQGSLMYGMLYLNNPKDPALSEFKYTDLMWFSFNDQGEIVLELRDGSFELVPMDTLKRVQFWDPAMTEREKKRNSRNAMVVMGKDHKGRLFLLDAWADYKDPTLLFSRFIGYHQRYNVHIAAIEDSGFQRTLKFPLYHLMREVGHSFGVREQPPIGEKHARIRSLLPYVESHLLCVRRGLTDFVEEFKNFPISRTLDILDATSACLPLFGMGDVPSERERARSALKQQANLASRSATTGY